MLSEVEVVKSVMNESRGDEETENEKEDSCCFSSVRQLKSKMFWSGGSYFQPYNNLVLAG